MCVPKRFGERGSVRVRMCTLGVWRFGTVFIGRASDGVERGGAMDYCLTFVDHATNE